MWNTYAVRWSTNEQLKEDYKMKIKRSGVAYQMMDAVGMTPSQNGCVVFWQFVGSALVCASLGIVVACIIIGLLACVTGVFYIPALMFGWLPNPAAESLLNVIIGLGAFSWVFMIIYSVWWSVGAVKNKINASEREPSLVTQYIRAKKQKICPIVEYVD
jgi:hypothetical protein